MFTCRRFLFADAFTSVGRLLRATIFMFLTMAWLPMHAWSAPQQLAVAAWGNNSYGECDVPPDLTNACFVVAGSSHNLAILSNGTVRDWGGNGYPTPANLSGIKTVDERFSVAFALSSNGTVTAWGANYYGGRDVPADLTGVVAIAAGDYHGLALQSDGTVVGWGGQDGAGVVPFGLANVVATSAGISHSLALKSDGTLIAWGWNRHGQTSIPAGLNNVVAISAGGYHSMALKADGTVVVWGGQDASVQPPAGLSNVIKISAGTWHNLALKSDGTVVAWGDNSRHQCDVPISLKEVVEISAGHLHSVALSASLVPNIRVQPRDMIADAGGNAAFDVAAVGLGTLTYQWLKDGVVLAGANASNLSLANLDSTNAGSYAVVVSNFSGSVTSAPAVLTVLTAGSTGGALVSLSATDPPAGYLNIVAASANRSAVFALRADGTVGVYLTSLAFGTVLANIPPGLNNVVAVATGENFALALRGDGTVTAWGFIPAPPVGLSGVTAIGAGTSRAYAVKSDGTLVSWGSGPAPPELSNLVAVSGTWDSGIALRTDGTAVQWGNFLPNVLGGETNLIAISAGGPFVGGIYPLGLRADGTVAGGGVPEGLTGVTAISSGGGYGLALKSNGDVAGLGSADIAASLSHVTEVTANGGYGLVITRWPVIKVQPVSVTNQPGSSATFSVAVRGIGPFTFQWRKDGAAISGATGSSLMVNNASNGDIGDYSVVVANSSGSVTSSPATLHLFGAPQITAQPQSQTVFHGAKVGFSVKALGAEPLAFHWLHGSTPVSGATSSELVIAAVDSSDAGSYTVVVSNAIGQATSQSATLTVTAAPSWQHSVPGTGVGLGGPAVPPELTNVVAVAAGSTHGLALRENGTVLGWGNDFLGPVSVPAGLSNVVAISAGERLSLALKADGTVTGWGWMGSEVPPGLYGVVGIAAGHYHSLAIKSDGTVTAWGLGITGPNAVSASVTNVVAIDTGYDASVALRQDGTVVTWGGLLNPGGYFPSGLSGIAAVSLGQTYLLALRNDGTVVGGPDGLSNVVAIAAGGGPRTGMGLALKSDGTVVGWGGINPPAGLSNVTAVSVGGFGLVITTNPPPPELAANLLSGEIAINSSVSVPGYVLEFAEDPSQPFVEVPGYTNSFTFTNAENAGFTIPVTGTKGVYRLRKR